MLNTADTSSIAKSIEEEAYNTVTASSIDEGIEILQVYSPAIGIRLLQRVKEGDEDTLMKEMHVNGVTTNDIVEVLKRTPIHPRIVPAIKAAHAAGCELRIVSDANTFFIETILDHLGLSDYFSEINTNPGYVDEEGRLRILPHHDFTKSPHGCCNPCPPNMCKGLVIKRLLCEHGNKKFIYLGDGIGDYCPSLRLRESDYLMPRKDFPVWDLISNNPKLIKSKIHEWTDGAEFERVLLSLIQAIITNADANQFFNLDCKFESLPISSHDAMPQALRVPI
uniref:WPP domain-containing protein n=1 Tax=Chenopodium quinoa TaxID=63459 RepID=A0A803M647_CHEQI